MKKQILFAALTITGMIVVSCKKEAIDTGITQSSIANNIENSSLMFQDPTTLNLEALYRFNGDLKEATGKYATGIPTGAGLTFTADRKGHVNAAIQFTGSYGFDITYIKMQPHASISVWVKYDATPASIIRFVSGQTAGGPDLGQNFNKYGASISTPGTTGIYTPVVDNKWHHLVTTYDGDYLKLYLDGVYVGYSKNPMNYSWANIKQLIGYTPIIGGNAYWMGSMDDLRYYSRTLTTSDVTALYNL